MISLSSMFKNGIIYLFYVLFVSSFLISDVSARSSYDYDVIVIGGEPEGVAAAVSAARNGAKVLLVDERDGLGGLFTYGYLNQLDLGYDKSRQLANQGIFLEWYKMMGSIANFDTPLAKSKFLELVQNESNITLLLETKVLSALKEDNTVTGAVLNGPEGEKTVYAKRFIDCTADAKFAVMAGVSFSVGQSDMGMPDSKMATTLVMLLKNVNWEKMGDEGANKGVLGGAKVHKNIAWGFAQVPNVYKPIEKGTRVRGLNIGVQSDGIVTINALQIFGVDTTDPESIAEGIERGKREIQHFSEFLRKELPGFENVEIAGYPSELYIRETRHVLSEYQLPITDVWENKDHWDSIGFGAYPVDVQATDVSGYGMVVVSPTQYAIPFRSLVPLHIDNLLVASKSSGYSSLAAGSARTVPIGMTAAEAAGLASVISIAENVTFRELSKSKPLISNLQADLKKQGALLYPFTLPYPYQGEWFYPALKKIMPYGYILGGYNNDIKPNEEMTEREFLRVLSGVMIRSNPDLFNSLSIHYNPWLESNKVSSSQKMTRDRALSHLLAFFQYDTNSHVWNEAIKYELVDSISIKRLNSNSLLTKAEGYQLIAHLLNKIDEGRFEYMKYAGLTNIGYIEPYNALTMVPSRFVIEHFGASINWDSAKREIHIQHNDDEIILKQDEYSAWVNGEKVAIDAKVTVTNGVSYVPIRFISEALDSTVTWNSETKEVTLIRDDMSITIPTFMK